MISEWRFPEWHDLLAGTAGCQLLSAALVRSRVCRQARQCLLSPPRGIRILTAPRIMLQPASLTRVRRHVHRGNSWRRVLTQKCSQGSDTHVSFRPHSRNRELRLSGSVAVLGDDADRRLWRLRPPPGRQSRTSACTGPPWSTRPSSPRRRGQLPVSQKLRAPGAGQPASTKR